MNLGSGAMATRRLLIVGDPALSRGLMKMVLSRLGYVVTCVVTGQESLMALSHSSFALALIALHLPDLPGLTLARRLRQAPAPVGTMPIIMFGDAWDPERILDSCREAGLAGYLPKPISIARLVSSIHDHIHRPQAEPGAPPTMPQPPAFEVERLTSFTDGDPAARARADLALSGDRRGLSRRDARAPRTAATAGPRPRTRSKAPAPISAPPRLPGWPRRPSMAGRRPTGWRGSTRRWRPCATFLRQRADAMAAPRPVRRTG